MFIRCYNSIKTLFKRCFNAVYVLHISFFRNFQGFLYLISL
nr:MAG TPA: hypothetical protein [Caudoviricetes sp.]